jgi:NAD(P)-dependent dehydrogenase (short-subunit alcohol dehydrogenase family)
MTGLFDRHAVLVTGAGEGIGFALCKAFAEAGADVALNDLDRQKAQHAAAHLNASIGAERVTPYALDIADVAAVRAMVDDFSQRRGRLDVVIANAGITNFGPFLEYTPEAFDRVTSVNLRGTYFTAQAAARAMIRHKQSSGRILLMSSVTGVMGYPNLTAYGMTKAGIAHLAQSLAVELGPHGITVNTLCPGATLTERTLRDDPHYARNWEAVAPNQRVGTVDDLAHAALFLASAGARHITGQTLVIDGGWTVTRPIPPDTPDLPAESSKLR